MKWTEILVTVATSDLSRVQDELHAITLKHLKSINGLYIEDYSDIEQAVSGMAMADLIEEELLKKDRTVGVIHLYLSQEENPSEFKALIGEMLKAGKIPAQIAVKTIDEEDWANNWKQFFKPFKVGNRIIIKPEWETYERRNDQERVLVIDPGMAFGTGGHATTRMCIVLLERYLAECAAGGKGADLLDIGTGSGILSVAAILLGARSSLGVDIDKYAIKKAKENAALNGVQEKTAFRFGDLANGVEGKYDIICANIVADAVIKLSGEVGRFLKPGGVFICSGIIDEREKDVMDALKYSGLPTTEIMREECWTAIAARQ